MAINKPSARFGRVSALAGRESRGQKTRERLLHETESQVKDFIFGLICNRILGGFMITWCLRQHSPWVMERVNDKKRKDRGPLRRL